MAEGKDINLPSERQQREDTARIQRAGAEMDRQLKRDQEINSRNMRKAMRKGKRQSKGRR